MTEIAKSVTTIVPRREEYMFKEKGTLIITEDFQKQIDYLHKKVGPIEWCGILFYRKLEGELDQPATLKLQAEQIYLMDVGSSAYTEADIDNDSLIEMHEVMDPSLKKGLIHTHHNMTTFFSGTDMAELHDNTEYHNYYLSLIVNFAGVYTARVSFIAKKVTSMSYKDSNDQEKEQSDSKQLLAMIEMNIVKERQEVIVPDFFRSRYEFIDEKTKEKAAATTTRFTNWNANSAGNYGGNSGVSKACAPSAKTHGFGCNEDVDDELDERGEYYHGYGGKPKVRDSRASSTQGKISFTPEGNLYKCGKILRPLTKVEEEIRDAIMEWLSAGVDLCHGLEVSQVLNTISAYMTLFDEYFDKQKVSDVGYQWFSNQMQRNMIDAFGSFFPKIVSEVGANALEVYTTDNGVALDLYNMFECYPLYVSEMSKLEDTEIDGAPFIEDAPRTTIRKVK